MITFNKTNDSVYGDLDEAILSKNGEKVFELYSEMSDKEKEKLKGERKSSIALLLYQVGQKDIADELVGTKKDEK